MNYKRKKINNKSATNRCLVQNYSKLIFISDEKYFILHKGDFYDIN